MERPVDIERTVHGGAPGDALRAVMARYPTGVTVVTTRDASGGPRGLTVNSFTSVSLDPPLVLVCIHREASAHDVLTREGCTFTVNILSHRQVEVARRFARRPAEGRFDGLDWEPGPSGNPVLAGTAGWLDCAVRDVYEAGDHSIVVGLVTACEAGEARALLFHRGLLGPVGE
ncbi:MAG TPA: flavin reductase family protein [Longimicrobiales bacterium]|nr:flavin reductase family protein [Longimicrobiales bacterium]